VLITYELDPPVYIGPFAYSAYLLVIVWDPDVAGGPSTRSVDAVVVVIAVVDVIVGDLI
jgi:hypothetical protein